MGPIESVSRFLCLIGVLLTVWGCDSPSAESPREVLPLSLERGGWVSITGTADLRGIPEAPRDNPAVWVPQPLAAREGWGRLQKGWHPEGDRATLTHWSPSRQGTTLEVEFVHRRDAAVSAHEVVVALNGHPVGGFFTQPGPVAGRMFLPPGLLREVNEVELRFDPPVAESHTERPGHLALIGFGIGGSGRSPRPTRGRLHEQLHSDGTLKITRQGVFVLPWVVPAGAEELRLEGRGLGEGSTWLELFAVRNSGQRVDLLRREIEGGEALREVVEVGDLAGERVALCLEVVPTGRRQGLEVEGLWVTSRTNEASGEPPPAAPGSDSRRPDILLVILDAARGDRFPGSGYPRPVMPHIEALSRNSLVFRNAFAECPTTSCSVPAMVTGVSFLAGGEVFEGRQLSDEVTTLAEYLKSLGYRTVGYSASPNNSTSRNLQQGFDVFRELWGQGNPDHGPFNMSRLAVETIRGQPEGEPLFLQLHYLPPHQPYRPGPEFDHFTDPEYSGPVRPWISFLPYNNGVETLGEEDLKHLIGLYDGNLLLADSAVEEVLVALREAGRFDDTLVVITSDHGEAFREHGMLGHNTTLFDEMLHVPLIFRLPGGEVPEGYDAERLASTLDIVPTILGFLDLAPTGPLGGIDLIHSPPDPQGTRALFLRTSHPKDGMVAVRTRDWKQISWPRLHGQMLFHLVEDPAEEVNLVGSQPYLFAGLGLEIRQHMVESSARQLEAPEIRLSLEAEEALRALGYIE